MRIIPATLVTIHPAHRPAPKTTSQSRIFSRRSLHGRVAHEIGARIVRGEMVPGEALPNEADWSARLKVSRTALREAIKVLAAKGLIESRPKTGTRVRPREDWNFLDPDVLAWRLAAAPIDRYVKDLFELRRVIEPAAASLAALRATATEIERIEDAYRGLEAAGDDGELWVEPDLRFHQAIIQTTDNELIGALGALIETALTMSFRLSNDNPAGQRHALPLHYGVLAAIRAGDGEGARRAMLLLLDHSEEDVRRSVSSRRGFVITSIGPSD